MTLRQKIRLPHKFVPRWYQEDVLNKLDSGYTQAVCVHHRGAGKDLMALNYAIKEAMQPDKVGVYIHAFPNFNQGKRAIWKSVHLTDEGEPMSYLDHIPPEIIKTKNSSEMMIELINGSIYCVMGIDGKNAARARGMNPRFIILSEYAYMDPESWYTIEPRVSQNKGKAIFLSTPNGKNHFYDLYNTALANPDEYCASLVTLDDTKVLPSNHIEKLRSQGYPEDFIQQEYYCSFTRGAAGSYYGKLIQDARDYDRIGDIPIIPDLPVYSSWDLGMRDSTSIWLFQVLSNGTYNFIHYYENTGEGLTHYLNYLNEYKSNKRISYAQHFVPFDAKSREFTSGVDMLETCQNFGYTMTVVPKKSIMEGIQAVRSIIPLCKFDQSNCKRGIECLDFYHKKWNDSLKVYYDEPLHDQWSHGADSFRYGAIGIKSCISGGSLESDYKALQKYWG